MSDSEDDKKSESTVEGTLKAVKDLVKEVPVYEDAVQPLAKQTGKALETVGKAVNAALIPVKGLVWGAEKIEEFVKTKVTEKLRNIPEENIQTPDPSIAGPVIESLRYTGHKENLSNLYASLLATSMDSNTAGNAHPGFVEIIKNMSSDEARIMQYLIYNGSQPVLNIRRKLISLNGGITTHKNVSFVGTNSGCENKELTPSYFDNLTRLGLINIPDGKTLKKKGVYEPLLNDDDVVAIRKQIDEMDDSKSEVEELFVEVTELGKLFAKACVIEK